MGKRELILIAAFVLVGAVVYQFTAPPPAPGERSFSFGRIVDNVRREVRGNRASAKSTLTASQAVDPSVTELRVVMTGGAIAIVGEDRDTVDVSMDITSTGYDEAEAQRLISESAPKFEAAGSILFVRVTFPQGGRQTAALRLKVPSRLRVRLESNRGKLEVRNVASVELGLARGETIVEDVKERATISHRGGALTVSRVGTAKITTRGSDLTLDDIRGEVVLSVQAGTLKAGAIAGPIEVDATATGLTFEQLEKTTGMIRINAVAGALSLKGLRSESRIDVRNATVEAAIDRPALIAIYNEGDEPVNITVPPAGFRIDAVSRDAAIVGRSSELIPGWGLRVEPADAGNRLTGAVRGGGPLLTVRARGTITLAER